MNLLEAASGLALRHLKEGRIQSGEIRLEPQWSADYAQLARDYVATLP